MPSKTTPSVSSSNHPALGTLIDEGTLELVEVLGVGGYGVVYRAEDTFTSSPKSYAVKCLMHSSLHSSRQRQLHIREITLHQIASAHPNVVSLHRVVEDHKYTYIIMDYAPDHDLFSQILNNCRYLGRDHLIKHVFLQLLDAVEYCHSLGIYHRDLKPENVLCFDDGLRIAITDFGLATTDKVSTEFRTGSVYHMSPECQGGDFALSGTYSPMANDIWSLGIILLNLATGRNPWKSATASDPTFQAYLRDPQGFLPTVLPISQEINSVLVRMLDIDWRERLTLAELRQLIEDISSFYSEGAIFEGSMARCPWEADMDIDSDSSKELPPVNSHHAELKSHWSSDTDSDIIFASPSTTAESNYGQSWTQDAACQAMWEMDSVDMRSLFVRPRTPASSRSLLSPCNSGSACSFPKTPNSIDHSFGGRAHIHDVRSRQKVPLTINTNFCRPQHYNNPSPSMKSFTTASSVMQTAVEYDPYDSSFFLASAASPSSKLSEMPESVILDSFSYDDKAMSSPSVYSGTDISLNSKYSSTRSFFEIATEGRSDSPSPSIHTHPLVHIQNTPSSSGSTDQDVTPPLSLSSKNFKLLGEKTKTRFLDLFPRSRSPSRSPSPSPPVIPPRHTYDSSFEDDSLPEPFTAFTFGKLTPSPLMENWPGLALPKAPAVPERPVCPRTTYLRSPRYWFLPGKLFTSSGTS
ncbi:kinase-like protein [Armillaria gallica]|uniref:Kinase-like protein n=1 Tax=Armillaria gallica TaxID=47427 RepID=A0A2H3E5M8_ARMGA|nr:kinase-like protein [Armillaria gallica]